MKIEQLPLSELTPYENNPRINAGAVAGVKASIEKFGYLVPIVVDKDMVIVTGHTRYAAMQEIGIEDEVPVIVADHLTEDEARAFRLADNRVNENSRWDDDLLRLEMELLQSVGFDLKETGFTVEEVDCLMDPISADCLDDLGTGVTPIEEVKANQQVMVLFSLGTMRFYVKVDEYNEWEKALLMQHGSADAVTSHLAEMLGVTKIKGKDKNEGSKQSD